MSAVERLEILELDALLTTPPRLPDRYDADDRCRECRSHRDTSDMAGCALAVLANKAAAGRRVLGAETIERVARVPRSPWRVVAALMGRWESTRLFYPVILTGKPGVFALMGSGACNNPEQAEERLRNVIGGYREGWVATYAGAYQVFSRH